MTTGDLPWAWQRGNLLLSDPALEADGTPMAARASDDGGLAYAEWSAARLVLLPKKGDLMLTKNWRGICLLDIGSKILSNVMVKRMRSRWASRCRRASDPSARRSTGSSR